MGLLHTDKYDGTVGGWFAFGLFKINCLCHDLQTEC